MILCMHKSLKTKETDTRPRSQIIDYSLSSVVNDKINEMANIFSNYVNLLIGNDTVISQDKMNGLNRDCYNLARKAYNIIKANRILNDSQRTMIQVRITSVIQGIVDSVLRDKTYEVNLKNTWEFR